MNENKEASDALLDGIKYIIQNEIKKAPMDKTYTAIIKDSKEDNMYDIIMQGNKYENIPSIVIGLKIGDIVKIKVPQNQYSLMYIEGKINGIDFISFSNRLDSLEEKINQILAQ